MGFSTERLKSIRFIWDIHYRCNYRCHYCWFYPRWATISKDGTYPSTEEWMRAWNRIYDLYGEVYIEITGGEPFIYPDFPYLLKQLSDRHKVAVTTNLSINRETINYLVGMLDNTRVDFKVSFHPLFVSIEDFLGKTVILKEKGFCNCVQFVAYPAQIKMMTYFENKAKEKNLIFSVTSFWGTYNNKTYPQSYTAEEKEKLKTYIKDINRINLNVEAKSPKGKLCYAASRFALIKGNGDVVRCGQATPEDKIDKIGNFLDSNFCLHKEPAPCPYECCPCSEYMSVSEMVE